MTKKKTFPIIYRVLYRGRPGTCVQPAIFKSKVAAEFSSSLKHIYVSLDKILLCVDHTFILLTFLPKQERQELGKRGRESAV